MKILLINLPIIFLLVLTANTQDDKRIIEVNKVQGVEAYFLSEPLQEYEVVLDSRNGLQWTSLITGGLVNESVSAKANQLTRKILKVAQEKNIDIHAVLYSGGKKIVGIRFKDDVDPASKGLAKVVKINGVEVYVLGEPTRDYKVKATVKSGIKMKSLLTSGIINNSIEDDIEKMIRKLNRKTSANGGIDAIIYQAGKSAIGVKFK